MSNKAVISLSTGLEDPEKVTVAYLVAVGAAESGRQTLMFLTKEAVRLALHGTATGVACVLLQRIAVRSVRRRRQACPQRVRRGPDSAGGLCGD